MDISGQRFDQLLVIKREKGKNNNVKYIVKCGCGELFTVHAFRLRDKTVTSCPLCRKEVRKARAKEARKKRNPIYNDYPCDETKFTLMDPGKTKILKSSFGKYIFFSVDKAEEAAKNIAEGISVVPVLEAERIISENENEIDIRQL